MFNSIVQQDGHALVAVGATLLVFLMALLHFRRKLSARQRKPHVAHKLVAGGSVVRIEPRQGGLLSPPSDTGYPLPHHLGRDIPFLSGEGDFRARLRQTTLPTGTVGEMPKSGARW